MAILTDSWLKDAGIVGIGTFAISFLGKRLVKGIEIAPKGAKVDLSSFPAIFRLKWNIAITNKTGITATAYQLDGEVFFGTVKLADVSIANPVTLQAGQTREVEFVIEVPPIQAIGDLIASIITNGVGAFLNKIRFKGLLKTSVLNIPLDMFIPIVP